VYNLWHYLNNFSQKYHIKSFCHEISPQILPYLVLRQDDWDFMLICWYSLVAILLNYCWHSENVMLLTFGSCSGLRFLSCSLKVNQFNKIISFWWIDVIAVISTVTSNIITFLWSKYPKSGEKPNSLWHFCKVLVTWKYILHRNSSKYDALANDSDWLYWCFGHTIFFFSEKEYWLEGRLVYLYDTQLVY
jgi:hypothetical protein